MNALPVIIHWLHLISVVFWIGGNAYQVFVLAPFIKSSDPSNEMLQKMSKRFTRLSLLCLLVLVVTGGMNLGFRRAGHEAIPTGYVSALAIKVFLAVAMSSGLIFTLIRPADETNPKKVPSLSFSKMSLALGIIIVFLAAMLRQWQF